MNNCLKTYKDTTMHRNSFQNCVSSHSMNNFRLSCIPFSAGQSRSLVLTVSQLLTTSLTLTSDSDSDSLLPHIAELLSSCLNSISVDLSTSAAVAAAAQQLISGFLQEPLGEALARVQRKPRKYKIPGRLVLLLKVFSSVIRWVLQLV